VLSHNGATCFAADGRNGCQTINRDPFESQTGGMLVAGTA
jgi:hypothetical protein